MRESAKSRSASFLKAAENPSGPPIRKTSSRVPRKACCPSHSANSAEVHSRPRSSKKTLVLPRVFSSKFRSPVESPALLRRPASRTGGISSTVNPVKCSIRLARSDCRARRCGSFVLPSQRMRIRMSKFVTSDECQVTSLKADQQAEPRVSLLFTRHLSLVTYR